VPFGSKEPVALGIILSRPFLKIISNNAIVFGSDEHHCEWTAEFQFPDVRKPEKCTVFTQNERRREGILCYNPVQYSNSATFHIDCYSGSKDPKASTRGNVQLIWIFSLWARPWRTAPSLDDLEASQPLLYEPTKDEIKRSDFLEDWRKLPQEIKHEIMNMAYGSIFWKVSAARNWRERLPGLLCDEVTTLPLTDMKYWSRSGTVPKLVPTGDILTIAIDNLGIKSVEGSDCWPHPRKFDQARNREVSPASCL